MNPRDAVRSGKQTLSGTAVTVRRRRPFLDHVIRAYGRYIADGGDRLAAAATYFAFLSFFPLVALAFSVAGFVVDAYPDVERELIEQINSYLPGLADKLDVDSIARARVGVGLVGMVVLLLSGLGWIDAIRDAIRIMWHQSVEAGNIITRRIHDVGVLAGLGILVLVSLVVTSLSTSATGAFLGWVGLEGSTVAAWVTGILAITVALAIDLAIFLYLFWRLPVTTDRHRTVRGALLGAVGVELLKILGTWLVGRTTSNPVYGAFAVIVGLLIWINIVMRWTMFIAAWTVTAPYSDDVVPSGTAGGRAADGDDETGGEGEGEGRSDTGGKSETGGEGKSETRGESETGGKSEAGGEGKSETGGESETGAGGGTSADGTAAGATSVVAGSGVTCPARTPS